MPKRTRTRRAQNSVNRPSGIGSPDYDFGQNTSPGSRVWLSPLQQDQFAVSWYYSDWQAKKIVDIPVDDMLREAWQYEGIDDVQQNALETAQDKLNVLETFRQAMRLERLIGGAAILLGVTDGQGDPSIPLDLSTLDRGCLRFLNVIPRSRIQKVELANDPLSPEYGRPQFYFIQGQRVHRSRLILFLGDPLLSAPDGTIMPTQYSRNDGFGQSKLTSIYDDLVRATGSRQAAYQLAQRAGVFIAQMDLLDLEGSNAGQSAISQMQTIVNQLNAFRGAVIHRDAAQGFEPVATITPSFGSVPELVMSFLQVLSAASDIPATRFLGQAPGGLNATGESDLENYYGRIESAQRLSLRPQLMQLLEVMGRSVFGAGFKSTSVDITFPPLWSLSEKEQAEVRTADINNVNALVTNGLLTDAEAIEELKQRDALKVEPQQLPSYEPSPDEEAGGLPLI
jgi:phage-related protein (TIGR01555 family)